MWHELTITPRPAANASRSRAVESSSSVGCAHGCQKSVDLTLSSIRCSARERLHLVRTLGAPDDRLHRRNRPRAFLRLSHPQRPPARFRAPHHQRGWQQSAQPRVRGQPSAEVRRRQRARRDRAPRRLQCPRQLGGASVPTEGILPCRRSACAPAAARDAGVSGRRRRQGSMQASIGAVIRRP